MRSLILLANKISRELRKSSCRPAGAPESSPRSSTARARRRRRRATPHGRIRTGRCSPGERPTSPTPASARPPTRAHPDPEPHRTMRWRLMYAVRPVSVPDNARRYGPAVRFRERYSGNGGASGRSTTDYRGVHGSLRSPFTFRGLAARFTPRSRLRGLASLDLAMRSRLATLAVHVIEALTSVRASLCTRGSLCSPLASSRARFARPRYAPSGTPASRASGRSDGARPRECAVRELNPG